MYLTVNDFGTVELWTHKPKRCRWNSYSNIERVAWYSDEGQHMTLYNITPRRLNTHNSPMEVDLKFEFKHQTIGDVI